MSLVGVDKTSVTALKERSSVSYLDTVLET